MEAVARPMTSTSRDRLADHPGDAAVRGARRDEWSSSLTQAGAATVEADALPERAAVEPRDVTAAEVVIASHAGRRSRRDTAQLPTGAIDP
jgi:hypothetical protein